jgi:hypothetical protein
MDARVLAAEILEEGLGELLMALRDGAVDIEEAEDQLKLHLGELAELWLLSRPGDERAAGVVDQLSDCMYPDIG